MAKTRTAIGLDLGGQTAKVVRLSLSKEGVRVDEAAMHHWSPRAVEPDERVTELREWLQSLKIRGGHVTLAISGSYCNIQLASFPRASDASLARMVRLEAQRLAGISDQEVAFDYVTHPSTNAEQSTVLLALCREATVSRELKLVADTGLTADDITVANLALYHAFHFKPSAGDEGLVAYVDIGRDSTDIALSHNGVLRFARSFASGSGAFTSAVARAAGLDELEAEQWKQSFGQLFPEGVPAGQKEQALEQAAGFWLSEFNETLAHFFEQTSGEFTAYDRIVLTGGGAMLREFATWLAHHTGKPVRIGAPLKALFNKLPPELENDPRFAVALGLALQGLGQVSALSLLPFALKEKRKVRRQIRQLAVYSALLTVIFLTLLGAARNKINQINEKLEAQRKNLIECQAKARAIEKLREDAKQVTDMARPVAELANRGDKFLTVWRDISNQRLGSDWFTLFADEDLYFAAARTNQPSSRPMPMGGAARPAEEKTELSAIILEGYTPNRSLETVTRFARALEERFPYFKKVDTLREDRRLSDPSADEWWAKSGHRRFTLELRLDWSRLSTEAVTSQPSVKNARPSNPRPETNLVEVTAENEEHIP